MMEWVADKQQKTLKISRINNILIMQSILSLKDAQNVIILLRKTIA